MHSSSCHEDLRDLTYTWQVYVFKYASSNYYNAHSAIHEDQGNLNSIFFRLYIFADSFNRFYSDSLRIVDSNFHKQSYLRLYIWCRHTFEIAYVDLFDRTSRSFLFCLPFAFILLKILCAWFSQASTTTEVISSIILSVPTCCIRKATRTATATILPSTT